MGAKLVPIGSETIYITVLLQRQKLSTKHHATAGDCLAVDYQFILKIVIHTIRHRNAMLPIATSFDTFAYGATFRQVYELKSKSLQFECKFTIGSSRTGPAKTKFTLYTWIVQTDDCFQGLHIKLSL